MNIHTYFLYNSTLNILLNYIYLLLFCKSLLHDFILLPKDYYYYYYYHYYKFIEPKTRNI